MTENEHTSTTPTASENRQIDSLVEQVITTVSSWPAVVVGKGQFNSTTFQIGQPDEARRQSEIGHVHQHPWGLVDISYPQSLREQLLVEGHTEKHHVVPERATTFALESEDDIEQAVFLLRLSYLYHVSSLDRETDTDEQVEIMDLDVAAEISKLQLSDELHTVVTGLISVE
ncbi:luciferase domain-containing protein [Halocatena marina]|uniref:Luciferase family protein n=1 Tax=Halocatena marina TaxID=2934937 RepID=A0ABD5YRP4_9EURY|nr:luciferase family protein [Halocatena marina]